MNSVVCGLMKWLPLKDLFCNHKLEFDFTLQNIQTVFETFKIQPVYA